MSPDFLKQRITQIWLGLHLADNESLFIGEGRPYVLRAALLGLSTLGNRSLVMLVSISSILLGKLFQLYFA